MATTSAVPRVTITAFWKPDISAHVFFAIAVLTFSFRNAGGKSLVRVADVSLPGSGAAVHTCGQFRSMIVVAVPGSGPRE